MIYLRLFWCLFQVGICSIGGGYVALPLIQRQVVELNGWLTATEFTDLISIAEMTPGPIALNASTFVGIKMAGIPGAIVATLGCITPSCIIVIILARLYFRYRSMNAVRDALGCIRPAVVGMIASAGLTILLLAFFTSGKLPRSAGEIKYISVAIFAAAVFVLRKWKVKPIYIIAGSGIVGLAAYSIAG